MSNGTAPMPPELVTKAEFARGCLILLVIILLVGWAAWEFSSAYNLAKELEELDATKSINQLHARQRVDNGAGAVIYKTPTGEIWVIQGYKQNEGDND